MKITSIKTQKIVLNDNIFKILDKYLPKVSEKSVIAITSKIVALCEGRVVPTEGTDKDALIEQASEYYLPPTSSKYDVSLTITNNTLAASAGIDESNSDGNYVLWPKDPQQSANDLRRYLKRRFTLKNVGVLITDSKTTPLRWGATGTAIGYSGFQALENYIGKKDLFGRKFEYTKSNIADGLAAAAVVAMGEGKEQTPLALVTDIPFVRFVDRNPSEDELQRMRIDMKDDLYAPLLQNAPWRRGKGKA